jgi:hypothetical protein
LAPSPGPALVMKKLMLDAGACDKLNWDALAAAAITSAQAHINLFISVLLIVLRCWGIGIALWRP